MDCSMILKTIKYKLFKEINLYLINYKWSILYSIILIVLTGV